VAKTVNSTSGVSSVVVVVVGVVVVVVVVLVEVKVLGVDERVASISHLMSNSSSLEGNSFALWYFLHAAIRFRRSSGMAFGRSSRGGNDDGRSCGSLAFE